MNLAFCVYKYFPYGGLQRDFLRIAMACHNRGHQVTVYTTSWQGQQPKELSIHLIKPKGLTNHDKIHNFSCVVNKFKQETKPELVIGFNKIPGLDIYYCADSCYVAKVDEQKSSVVKLFYKLSNRYKIYSLFEQHVFAADSHTKVLYLSDSEQVNYNKYYNNNRKNSFLLPPHINKERFLPVTSSEQRKQIKDDVVSELAVSMQTQLLLMVGSGFKTKGADRSIKLLAYLLKQNLDVHLVIIGQDNPSSFRRLIKELKLTTYVTFLQGRDDIAKFMVAASLLLHPAYRENTGTVILESIIMGLPVVASAVCGYSQYIQSSGCGKVITEPFLQDEFNKEVTNILVNNKIKQFATKGIEFRQKADIYNADDKILEIIENV